MFFELSYAQLGISIFKHSINEQAYPTLGFARTSNGYKNKTKDRLMKASSSEDQIGHSTQDWALACLSLFLHLGGRVRGKKIMKAKGFWVRLVIQLPI